MSRPGCRCATREGRCIPAEIGESGELLGRLSSRAEHSFEGYTNRGETDRKILRDVLAPGDAWMRTGDLMRRDAQGFYYFVDRIGDTFRWKGENVATTEVAAALGACDGVTEANVYGVTVPGADGRAGMAAITVTAGFDLEPPARDAGGKAAGLCPAALPADRRHLRPHRNLQAEEDRAGGRGLRPRHRSPTRSMSIATAPIARSTAISTALSPPGRSGFRPQRPVRGRNRRERPVAARVESRRRGPGGRPVAAPIYGALTTRRYDRSSPSPAVTPAEHDA